MAMEKFKMSYTYSLSGSLNNGTMSGRVKMYQRETIFGKIVDEATVPFKSLSFANGGSSVTAEDDGIVYTVTLENKDIIIEAETVEDDAIIELEASISDIFHSLPTVYDENGNAINADTEFITATNGGVSYISIPNMVTGGTIS